MNAGRRRFDGRVAIVTGGGGSGDLLGVGAAISEFLAAEGCRVAVMDRDLDKATNTVDRIEQAGGTAVAVRGDVSKSDDCRKAVDDVIAAYGRLDVLVNNAAVEANPIHEDTSKGRLPRPALITEMSEDNWDRVMAINVKGMMLMTKYSAPHFTKGASIVTISSSGALHPSKGTSAYVTSKGAVISLTLAMAVDLAPTRANCICPDRIWAPMFVRRLPADPDQINTLRAERIRGTLVGTEGTAMDIARAAAFLASDEAQWITGQVLLVDGGRGLATGVTEARVSGWAIGTTSSTG